MKLTSLHEASTSSHAKHLRRAMDILKTVKPDATTDNLAWFAAIAESDVVSDMGRKDLAWMFYEGIKPMKDSEHLNDYWEREFEYLDDDYSGEESNRVLANRFKEQFPS